MLQRIKNSFGWRWKKAKVIARDYLGPKHQYDLIVVDDLFPWPVSVWRVVEYTGYLKNFSNSVVYSSGTALEYVKETRSFSELVAEYESSYPELRGRVLPFHPAQRLRGRLGFVTFLHCADNFLPTLEQNKLPFILQLYPGGNFKLNDPESDRMLAQICKSPYLRHIIVTQNVTHDYLLEKGFWPLEKITQIYGAVLPLGKYINSSEVRLRYPITKSTLDICFVAGKYTPQGRDKGYDLFIAAAKILTCQFDDLHFHVVGPYNEEDIPVEGLASKIHFYGYQRTEFFFGFYARMDAVVSPNRSFVLSPGGFDGFPLGSCMEAGACGTAFFCTDDLNQNTEFVDGKDIVLVLPDADDIARKLAAYLSNYDELMALGERTRLSIGRVFDDKMLLNKRLTIIKEQLTALDAAM